MGIIHTTWQWLTKYRLIEIEKIKSNPVPYQENVFEYLISQAENTEWGKKYNYKDIKSIEDFQKQVPVSTYEDLAPYIERMMKGESEILWPGVISWFSKSSGTTGARSKYIPVSNESLEENNFKAGKDEVALYIKNNPETNFFDGKTLIVGGSYKKINDNPEIFCGDVSALMMKNLPMWGEYLRTPTLKTALMDGWEEKLDAMATESARENVTSIAGVPTWTIMLIRKVLEKTGKKNILEVWPNLEVFFHGAVSFEPYRELFKELIPKPNMHYMEAYNASEGFFALEDDLSLHNGMLLLPDCGIFYEFVLLSELDKEDKKFYTVADVELDRNYAIIISTNAGLARYVVGDTVKFTSLFPHRIKITGRTKHFINAFGEEVMVHNTDDAIKNACLATNSFVSEYTVAPIFMQGHNRGGHEWIIEFERAPVDIVEFTKILDDKLREINSDYDAKRAGDIALALPTIHTAPAGTFYNWMKSRNKIGGQHKVPRLSNERTYVNEILKYI